MAQKRLESEEKTKPLGHRRCGSVKVTAWKNMQKNQAGEEFETVNFTVERSYRDAKGEWQTTNSYRGKDLADLVSAAQSAREGFLVKAD